MLRGLYTSASGMLGERVRQDILANNLANLNTPGYRRDEVVFQSFPQLLLSRLEGDAPGMPVGHLGTGSLLAEVTMDDESGDLRDTGQPLDVALSRADQFFTIETPRGLRLTRAGSFSIDAQNRLSLGREGLVRGEKGPILVKEGPVSINSAGEVVAGGEIAGRLAITTVADPATLEKEGQNLLWDPQAAEAAATTGEYELIPGFLEGTNINPIGEMVNMIAVFRAYEANQKALKAQDETLGLAVTRLGELR